MEPIRLAVFGLDRGEAYLNSALKCNARLVALCDRAPKRRAALRERVDKSVVFCSSYDEMMAQKPEAVVLANCYPNHAAYAIDCLQRGVHVLCECASNATMAEGVALVRAAEQSSAIFMLAENYPYMKFNQEIKRICDGGTLGRFLFAEGEYNHPFNPNDGVFYPRHRPYEKHWRNFLPRAYYITHSLAPLMHATGARPVQVSALPVFVPFCEEDANGSYVGDRSAIITTLNDDRSVFRVTGCAGYGAEGNSYRICGEKGQVENPRGMGGQIMLRYNPWEVPEGSQATSCYEPAWHDPDADLAVAAGHEGSDFFVTRNFLRAVKTGEQPDFDVYFATTMASVGILAHRSILQGGVPIALPDFHREEDRKQYEADHLTPFWGEDGAPPTLPCCSNPHYRPSPAGLRRYREMIGQSDAGEATKTK